VTRRRGDSIAVYRDDAGALFGVSAKCSRRDGQVRWNSAERSWDCASCGSRFNVRGGILNGPAVAVLAPCPVEDPRSAVVAAIASASATSVARRPARPPPLPPGLAKDAALRGSYLASSGRK
jgi:Rieske Fe-S protein